MKRGLKFFGVLAGLFFILMILFFAFSSEGFYGKITGDVVSEESCSSETGEILSGDFYCSSDIGDGEIWIQNYFCGGGELCVECENGYEFKEGNCALIQTAPVPVDGKCGSSNGQTFSAKPATNLCLQGASSSITENSIKYSWTCAGSNGGITKSCSAVKQVLSESETTPETTPSQSSSQTASTNGETGTSTSSETATQTIDKIPDKISKDLGLLKEAIENKDVEKCEDISNDNKNIKSSCFDIFSSTYEEDYCDETDVLKDLCKDKIDLFKTGEFPAFCGDNKINQDEEQCDGEDSNCVDSEYCNNCYCYNDAVAKAYFVKSVFDMGWYTGTELTKTEYSKLNEQDNNVLTKQGNIFIEFEINNPNIKNVKVDIGLSLSATIKGITIIDTNRKGISVEDYSKNGFFGSGGYYDISGANLNVVDGKARMRIGSPWNMNIDLIKISKYNEEVPTKS